MKKVMFLVMVAVMPFISCSSDDDNTNDGVNPLVGKWRESKFTETNYEDGEMTNTGETKATTTVYEELEFNVDATFSEFHSDSDTDQSGELIVETSTYDGTYEVKGTTLVRVYSPNEQSNENLVFETKYSISENVLIITSVREYGEDEIAYKTEFVTEYYRL